MSGRELSVAVAVLVCAGCGPTSEELEKERTARAEAVWKPFCHRVQQHLATYKPNGETGRICGKVTRAEFVRERMTTAVSDGICGEMQIWLIGDDVKDRSLQNAQTWVLYYSLESGSPTFHSADILRSVTKFDESGGVSHYLSPIEDIHTTKYDDVVDLWRLGIMPKD